MKLLAGVLLAAVAAAPIFADSTRQVDKRLTAATDVLTDMTQQGDKGIPEDLIRRASCVVVIPSLKKGGFIVGAEYGSGFFTCRRTTGVGWSAPGSIRITGGKFGLLIGAAETEVVMLVMNPSGMDHLLSDKFQMGGEASAAAGPVGRDASAMTDAALHAEILTYSKQRGIYGGLDLAGAAVTQDESANKDLYGREVTNKQIVAGEVHTPAEAHGFVHALDRISSRK
ncbi:MAG: lipid-binding SYLF domain-containing protein [Acidobacteriaceae bacterium]|nr:lipid-binding SYLF domain-containing protein [Acidobacteriaceae bacterium]